MKTINNYLDDLKAKSGSDNKAAELTGIDRTTIANARKRGQISDETAIKIADALGIERAELLIAATIARSHGEVKTAWEKFSKVSGVAASFLVVCLLNGGEIKTNKPSMEEMTTIQLPIICIMRSFMASAQY